MRDLLDIMAALRDPQGGCPWDLQQNFETIAPYTIEEAYEVADAIARGDMADLKDELGDLLFQVVYHAQMACEAGAFDFEDVVDAITRKMIRRHPHVFGDMQGAARDEIRGMWERIKAEEKSDKSPAEGIFPSMLDDVPLALPALTRACKLQDRLAPCGFEAPDMSGLFAKVREEFEELVHEIEASTAKDKIEAELGDVLFSLAKLARRLDIDPEAALARTNAKFVRRFRRVEEWLSQKGSSPADATLAEMDRLWERAKAEEREPG